MAASNPEGSLLVTEATLLTKIFSSPRRTKATSRRLRVQPLTMSQSRNPDGPAEERDTSTVIQRVTKHLSCEQSLPSGVTSRTGQTRRAITLVSTLPYQEFTTQESQTTLLMRMFPSKLHLTQSWIKYSRYMQAVTQVSLIITVIIFFLQAVDFSASVQRPLSVLCFFCALIVTLAYFGNINYRLLSILLLYLETLFFAGEALVFAFSLWGVFCFSVSGFFISAAALMSGFWFILYDAFPLYVRQTSLRWSCLLGFSGFSFLLFGVSMRLFKGMCFNRMDIFRGLIKEDDRTVWSFSIQEACLNAGCTLFLLAVRAVLVAVFRPSQCVIIQAPLRHVTTHTEKEQAIVDEEICRWTRRIALADQRAISLQQAREESLIRSSVTRLESSPYRSPPKWNLILVSEMPAKRLNALESSMTWMLKICGQRYNSFFLKNSKLLSVFLGSVSLIWFLVFTHLYPHNISEFRGLGFQISGVMALLQLGQMYAAVTNCTLSAMVYRSFDTMFILGECFLLSGSLFFVLCPTKPSPFYAICFFCAISLLSVPYDAISPNARRKLLKGFGMTVISLVLLMCFIHFHYLGTMCNCLYDMGYGFTILQPVRGLDDTTNLLVTLHKERKRTGEDAAFGGISILEFCLTRCLTLLILLSRVIVYGIRCPGLCTLLQSPIRLLEGIVAGEEEEIVTGEGKKEYDCKAASEVVVAATESSSSGITQRQEDIPQLRSGEEVTMKS